MKKIKYAVITMLVSIICLALIGAGFLWSWNNKIQNDLKTSKQDVVGKQFMTLYPDSYNAEFTNNKSIHLNAIADGQTNFILTIPRNGAESDYTLRCHDQIESGKEFFSLSGLSQEMIDAVKNAACYDKELRSTIGNK